MFSSRPPSAAEQRGEWNKKSETDTPQSEGRQLYCTREQDSTNASTDFLIKQSIVMFRARWHGESLLSQGLPVINNDSVPKVKDPRFQGAIQEQRGSVWGGCVTRVAFFDPATFAELEPLCVALVRNRWRREARTRTTPVQLGHPHIQHGPMSGHT